MTKPTNVRRGVVLAVLLGMVLVFRFFTADKGDLRSFIERENKPDKQSGTTRSNPAILEGGALPKLGQNSETKKAAAQLNEQGKRIVRTPITFSIRKFRGEVTAMIPRGYSVFTGGWETTPGKRAVVLSTPTISPQKQVII